MSMHCVSYELTNAVYFGHKIFNAVILSRGFNK